MRCYKHDVEAVSTCKCGKALCSDCTNLFTIPLCTDCAKIEAVSRVKKSRNDLILGIIFLGLPWGWKAVNKTLSFMNFILILPIAGWLILFGIKLALSIVVGVIMYPFKIILGIRKIKKSKEFHRYVFSIET
jgi:hypothetical protein